MLNRRNNINFLVFEDLSNQYRSEIHRGLLVDIVLKKDQKSGKLTRGIVKDILTNKFYHSRGIKVRLKNGKVGRVQNIINV